MIPERIKSGGGRVQFDLVFNATAVECSHVKRVLFTAGECLNNVIVIKEKILKHIHYYDFCGGNATCTPRVIGSSSHNEIVLGGRYKDYLYPQALVKQLGTKEIKSGRFHDYDMKIILDAKTKFQIVGQVNFTSENTSLLDLVAHEMLHGLGIGSSFNMLSKSRNLAMPWFVEGFNRTLNFTQNIFNSHLYIRETGEPLSKFLDKLNSLPKITRPQNHTLLLQPPTSTQSLNYLLFSPRTALSTFLPPTTARWIWIQAIQITDQVQHLATSIKATLT
ncbi:hypothetical protein DSO57_1018425 [Entomophthora muscae]|uniref:Uncharacterized protein n=1 Tax=Entomophthora muscae TaxID=34485 RepID=A0ACC2TF31_9FUNG|nr:hypothetical protein DSO57_1018425 [Entomophthora muscae]